MSDDFPYYRRERGRISQDYPEYDTSMYRPRQPLTLVPSGLRSGGLGMIRDRDGAAIGGGDVWSFTDMNGGGIDILVTPAVFEELKRRVGPISRCVPGEISMVLNLREYSDAAKEHFVQVLFSSAEHMDDDGSYYEVDPVLDKDNSEWLDETTIMVRSVDKRMISQVLDVCGYIEKNYLRDEVDSVSVSRCIYTMVQYVYDFPEPWQLDRIRSPWFWGERRAYSEGQYAWYFGRYGVFDNFVFPTTWRRFAPRDEEGTE